MSLIHLKNIITRYFIFFQNKILTRTLPLTPKRLRVLYIGGYWRGQNDIVAQMLHGLRKTGAYVTDFNTDTNQDALYTEGRPYDRGTFGPVWLKFNTLYPLILKCRPHIIVCNAGGLSFRPEDVKVLKKLGIKLLGIALSEPDVYQLTTKKIANNFDVFFTNDKNTVELHKQNGIKCYQLPMATDDTFFYPVNPKPEYECEVLHLGAAHPDRVEAVRLLTQNFNTHVYGEHWEKYGIQNRGFVLGEATLQALSSAKVVVVFSKTPSGKQIIKPQLFNFLSTGCLVATEVFPDLLEYFEPEIDVIGFKNTDELMQKIKYYLKHPYEADKIKHAGRLKSLEYTWDKTWSNLLETHIVPFFTIKRR